MLRLDQSQTENAEENNEQGAGAGANSLARKNTDSSNFTMKYTKNEAVYLTKVDFAYHQASSRLLHYFVRILDLKNRLHLLRKVFFLEQSDWVSMFLTQAREELELPYGSVNLQRLESILDASFRSANLENVSEEFTCTLHTFRIEDACARLFNNTKAAGNAPIAQDLPAIRCFALKYTPQVVNTFTRGPGGSSTSTSNAGAAAANNSSTIWPLSLLFSKTALLRYQCIFRHLLYCKYVEQKLTEIWLMEQKMAGSQNQIFLGNRGYCLRMRMYDFVRNLLVLSFVEIIEPNFLQLMKNIEVAESVDELFEFHDLFLYKCLSETLLLFGGGSSSGSAFGSSGSANKASMLTAQQKRNTMFITVSKILSTCILFCNAVRDFIERFGGIHFENSYSKEDNRAALVSVLNNEHYGKMIMKFEQIFDHQISLLVSQAREVIHTQYEHFLTQLLMRLDYNEYYGGADDDNVGGSRHDGSADGSSGSGSGSHHTGSGKHHTGSQSHHTGSSRVNRNLGGSDQVLPEEERIVDGRRVGAGSSSENREHGLGSIDGRDL